MTWLGTPALISSSTATAEQIWPGRAVAALEAVMLDEGGLHRMQVLRRAQPLDGGDLVALVHHRERQAGVDPPAVDDDRAGAALAVIAAFLVPVRCRCSRSASSSVVRVSSSRSRGLPFTSKETFDIGTSWTAAACAGPQAFAHWQSAAPR